MDGVRDSVSGVQVAIDPVHAVGHEGKLFHVHHERTDSGFDTGQTMDVLMVAGSRPVHLFWRLSGFGGHMKLTRTRGVTTVGDGTALDINCTNDVAPNPSMSMTAFHTPNTPSGGSVKDTFLLFGTTSIPNPIPSAIRGDEEIVLKPGEKTLFRVAALSDNVQAAIDFSVYER